MNKDKITLHIDVITKTLEPLAHFAGDPDYKKKGGGNKNISRINRMPMIVDGAPHHIPAVSGNSIRGILRDCAGKEICEAIDEPLDKNSFQLLFSGGKLTQNGGGDGPLIIDANVVKQYRELAFLDLFGAALNKIMIRSRLSVGWLIPMTKETLPDVPEAKELMNERLRAVESSSDDIPSLDDIERPGMISQARRDDTKNDMLMEFLAADAEVVITEGQNGENKKADGRAMPYHFEAIPANANMRGSLHVTNASRAAVGCLFAALRRFAMDGACLGGKQAAGFGSVVMAGFRANSPERIFILRPGSFELAENYQDMENVFREWVESLDIEEIKNAANFNNKSK